MSAAAPTPQGAEGDDRLCMGTNGRFRRERRGAFRWHVKRPYDMQTLMALRGRPWERLLKDDVTTRVAVEPLDGATEVVIKRYNPKGLFWAFRYSVRRSGGLRSWRGANALAARGIPTAAPIGAWEWRVGPILRESAFVMAHLVDCEELHTFVDRSLGELSGPERLAARRKAAELVGATLAAMHEGGLWHRDLKASNWMVRRHGADVKEVLLLDLDGLRFGRRVSERRRIKDVARLLRSLVALAGWRRSDGLRVLKHYLAASSLDEARLPVWWDRLTQV